jgi:flagellar biogenesis protein FliO
MTTRQLGASIPASRLSRMFAVTSTATPAKTIQNAAGLLSRAWEWIRTRQMARSNTRRLQVTSTVSLGEKRFVAVIQVDGLQFLVGGGASNVALLAQLDKKESFGKVLEETVSVPKKKSLKQTSKPIDKPNTRQSRAKLWSTL